MRNSAGQAFPSLSRLSKILKRPMSSPSKDKRGIPLIPPIASEMLRDLIITPSRDPFVVLPCVAEQTNNARHWIDPKTLPLREPIETYYARDPYPIPAVSDREGYYGDDRHLDWWLSGLRDFLAVEQNFLQYNGTLGNGRRILELGCASGRALRHFVCHAPDAQTWGCDINLRHVEWIRQFLPPYIPVFQNTILPHLPIEDRFFDLVCAFSVFTHIDHLELAWLAEVRRILKPGGIAYFSIHGETTWSKMGPEVPAYNSLMNARNEIKGPEVNEALFEGPIPEPKTVFAWETIRNYNSNVFHTTEYIHDPKKSS